jgi:hypothetical protein
MSLTALAVTDHLPAETVVVAALCVPLVLLGLWLGARTRTRLPRERFRQGVLVVCAASALVLLARSLG